jgi:hypothetical protein
MGIAHDAAVPMESQTSMGHGEFHRLRLVTSDFNRLN